MLFIIAHYMVCYFTGQVAETMIKALTAISSVEAVTLYIRDAGGGFYASKTHIRLVLVENTLIDNRRNLQHRLAHQQVEIVAERERSDFGDQDCE